MSANCAKVIRNKSMEKQAVQQIFTEERFFLDTTKCVFARWKYLFIACNKAIC